MVNDAKCQKIFYDRYLPYALRVSYRYVHSFDNAAHAANDAFVKIFKSIHSFDSSKGSLHAWIKKIVVNEGLDHIKSRNRFSETVEVETVAEPAINNYALEQMGAEEIMNLIKKLPPATHAVFIMYAVEGYNHREIAERLSISEGTSKWHLSEARKSLQKQLQHTDN